MKVFRGLEAIPAFKAGTVVAVGNFDGLHLGHRKILRRVASLAGSKDLFSLVLTFDPHPARSFKGRRSIPLIQTLDQRLEGLKKAGIKGTLILPFDRAFSRLSGRAFAERVLAGSLRARDIVVGVDFRFGFKRRFAIADLARLGRELGFGVHAVAPVILEGRPVSSSLIRGLIAQGDVEGAAGPLGAPYEIRGLVIRGAGRGANLGIPTANIRTANELLPPGVFLTQAGLGARLLPSVTNIGTGPTFESRPVHPETHILGARKPLYGRELRVLFIKKLRNERKFASPAALVRRIRLDIGKARQFFGRG